MAGVKGRSGGPRKGAGRKPVGIKRVLHASPIQIAESKISEKLPWLVGQLFILAEGVEVQKTDRHGQLRTYTDPPDRAAIEYLIDRILGKPAQPVDIRSYAQQVAALIGVDPDEIIDFAERRKATAG